MCSLEMLYGQLLFERLAAEEAQRDASSKEVAEFASSPANQPSATFDVGHFLSEFLRRRWRSAFSAGHYNTPSTSGNDHG